MASVLWVRTSKGKLFGRPRMRDFDSAYLLSGLARCGLCGGPIDALSRDYKRGKGGTYGCAYNRKRGSAICQNSARVDMDQLDNVLLQALSDILDERVAEAAVVEALRRLRLGEETRLDRRAAIERELSLIEAYEKNLVQAIARGDNMTPLLAQLKVEENRKKELVSELEFLVKSARFSDIDEARMKRDLRRRIADSKALLARHKAQARQVLRKLLDQPLMFESFSDNWKAGYKVTGQGSLLKLLPDQLATPYVVSPTGFEPVLPA
jgi:site-specific DNA recombinase